MRNTSNCFNFDKILRMHIFQSFIKKQIEGKGFQGLYAHLDELFKYL